MWREIDEKMKTKSRAQKYYAHVYRQVRFSGILSESAKEGMQKMIEESYKACLNKSGTLSPDKRLELIHDILDKYKKDAAGNPIFPERIVSYVYQTIGKLKGSAANISSEEGSCAANNAAANESNFGSMKFLQKVQDAQQASGTKGPSYGGQ